MNALEADFGTFSFLTNASFSNMYQILAPKFQLLQIRNPTIFQLELHFDKFQLLLFQTIFSKNVCISQNYYQSGLSRKKGVDMRPQ